MANIPQQLFGRHMILLPAHCEVHYEVGVARRRKGPTKGASADFTDNSFKVGFWSNDRRRPGVSNCMVRILAKKREDEVVYGFTCVDEYDVQQRKEFDVK
ncbi:unnamed protein product [Bursaphelenchus xylophilus]|uniref:(pine wood nematode) hypothetical protein n=1 Tax=Bursaphelenchus xylophilus TaxID=6326 RepID=A0A7I8X4K7_BURXY|nr:unnamed protein product [Bursaphelenchus xylophilus]CAG9128953.1 unnamed protein product [Bursaphelenchus xylophilus]